MTTSRAPSAMFVSIRVIRRQLGESVFPILCQGTGTKVAILATGFFIQDTGIFMSCAHVFEKPDVPNPRYFFLPKERCSLSDVIEIEEIDQYPQYDLAIGRVPDWKSKPIPISNCEPKSGDKVVLHGYPGRFLTKPREIAKPLITEMSVIHGDFDYTIDAHGREFRAIIASKTAPTGVSGGPLVDEQNKAIGVYSHWTPNHRTVQANGGDAVSIHVKLGAIPINFGTD